MAPETKFADSAGGGSSQNSHSMDATIETDRSYVFNLYDYSSDNRGSRLASTTVTAETVIQCPPLAN